MVAVTYSSKHIVTSQPVLSVRLMASTPEDINPEEIDPYMAESLDSDDTKEEISPDMDHALQAAWDAGYTAANAELQASIESEHRGDLEGLHQSTNTLKSIVEAISNNQHTLKMTEQTLISLACAIAGKIIHQTVDEDDELVVHSVQSALQRVHQTKSITIRVHPDDMDVIASHEPDFKSTLDQIDQVEIIPDTGIARGGCMVNTDSGTIDGCLSVQLTEIERALLNEGENEEILEPVEVAYSTE